MVGRVTSVQNEDRPWPSFSMKAVYGLGISLWICSAKKLALKLMI